MNKIFANDEEAQSIQWGEHNASIKSKRRNSSHEDSVSKEIQRMQHLSFDTISSVQFCIDGAVGLPLSTTATRVTARLMAHDRSQVGEPSAPSFSQPDSDTTSPVFDLHMGWRGSTLQPSLTIVCRIDTLERPSLQAKCMGFAALKLCVDENGLQPLPDLEHEHVFLNAGQYLLPIVFGSVPTDSTFTEAIMDKLPHIHNAFLKVRLFDPNVERDSGKAGLARVGLATPVSAPSPESSAFMSETSVASVIIMSHPFVNGALQKLPISEVILDEIQKGTALDAGERRVVLRQLGEWMVHAFPNIKQKIGVIDPRFIINYEDRSGALVALDMLYNMPNRLKLIPAARGMRKRFLRKKLWDNKVNCFKTFFRYLPGASATKRPSLQELQQAELIVDDASLELDVSSRELCPVYLDDFSRTAGIELSIHACVLVIVTAVDVLTHSGATTKKPTYYFQPAAKKYSAHHALGQQLHKPHHGDSTTETYASSSAQTEEEQRTAAKARQEREFKLRGLAGMFCGHEDPAATWWGIAPLMVDNPFYRPARTGDASPNGRSPAKSGRKADGTSSSSAAAGDNYSVSNSAGTYFIDAGTHQIPLFVGLPPEEMLTAPNPMSWLLGHLRAQTLDDHSRAEAASCCGNCCADTDVVTEKPQGELILSSGSSAFISVVDPRLKKFSDEPVTKDPGVAIKEDALRKVLKVVSAARAKRGTAAKASQQPHYDSRVVNVDPMQYNKLYASFQYGVANNKRIPKRTVEDALPHNVFHHELISEMNQLFLQAITG